MNGQGYAWKNTLIEIYLGDYVNWSWNAQKQGDLIHVQQVESADSTTPVYLGFSSGNPSNTGSYRHQFNLPGTFYFSSGYVDSSLNIYFNGIVHVKPNHPDRLVPPDVKTNNYESLFSFPKN